MKSVGTYYSTLVTEANNLWNSTTSSFVPTPYPLDSSITESSFYEEIQTAFVDPPTETLVPSCDYITYLSNESSIPLDEDGYCLTGYGKFLSYLNTFYEYTFRTPYKIMVAVFMFFFNHFFPIIKRTECDVSVNHPGAIKRVFNFALKTFYIVDKNSLEKVTATIKCIEIPTDKRDYWNTIISIACVVFMLLLLVLIDRGSNPNDRALVRRPVLRTNIPSPTLGINPDLMLNDEPRPRPHGRTDANGLGDLGNDVDPLIG